MQNYLEEFNYKIINDPIYGCIGLSKLEVRLLDTRAMQRLRRIRQMGFSSYVFPSGEHSRFVHSLGVLYIMGRMCNELYRQYGEVNADGINFSIEDVRIVRIAALLHDVGHFPFSHLSEVVYSYIDNKTNSSLMLNDNALEKDIKNTDDNLISSIANYGKHKQHDHEHLGAEIIKKDKEISVILDEAGIDKDTIGKIIYGDGSVNPIYAQLLHSSLDADRLDYLLRDSRQAGVVFGKIELDYIIRQIRIKSVHLKNGNINLIVFDQRGQHAIEHFLMGRYFHYTQVVMHKTSMAIEAVAKALLYKMLESHNGEFFSSYEKIVEKIGTDEFYGLTDDIFWVKLSEYCANAKEKYIKEWWECLSKRKKVNQIITITDIISKNKPCANSTPVNDSIYLLTKWQIKNNQNELAIKCDINPYQIGYVESKTFLESIPSHLKAEDCTIDNLTIADEVRGGIKILHKEGDISFLASDSKSLINKLVDFNSCSLDIFVVGDVENGKIEKLKNEIKNNARK